MNENPIGYSLEVFNAIDFAKKNIAPAALIWEWRGRKIKE